MFDLTKFAKDFLSDLGQRLMDLSESIPVQPAPIVRIAVKSDCAASIGYRVSDGTLEIEYQNGRAYRYSNVPFEVYMDLMDTPSIGRFINREIKPFYAHMEVKE